MHEGTWTIRPCPHRVQAELAASLGISELTAGVLVRRGYDDPEEARAFLEGELPPHDPFLLGDMRAAVRADPRCGRRRAPHLRARRLRRRRHRRHRRSPSSSCASSAPTSTGTCRAGSTRATACAARRSPGSPTRAAGSCSPSTAASPPWPRSPRRRRAGLEVIVTDHHRPGETLPDCPLVATRPSDYPFPELCGTGVVYKLGQALFGVDSEIPKRHLDLVALATIADVVPLLDENRSLAIAGLRALARTQKPGLQALMRAAGVDPAAVDAGAVGFRLAPRINAAGRLGHPRRGARAAAHRGRGRRAPARRLARGAEPRAAGGRGPDPARGDRAGRGVARGGAPPPRVRRRRRGLARGRDRDRRLAARRALQPPGRAHRRRRGRLEGLRPLDRRRSTCTPGSPPARRCSSAGAAIAPRPASRSSRRTSSRFAARVRRARRRRCSPTRTCAR